jgi:phosphatidylinositol alpha-1,6-mannosyltransferase
MVTRSIVQALGSAGPTRLLEHMSDASPLRRRLLYVRDWVLSARDRPKVNVYTHLDLARIEAALPPGVSPPYAIFVHGWEAWWPVGRAARRALEGARWILVNSETTARLVRKANPWLPDVIVVPLGLTRTPPDPGPWPRQKQVLMLGRLDASERQKGHDLVLDAWPSILGSHPDARLVIVGEGSDRPRLERRVRDEQLAGVVFEGFVSDERKWELLRRSFMLAFPSTQEGFGLVAIEAASVETPVVCLRETAVEEVFSGAAGAVFPEAPTAVGIGRAIDQLLGDSHAARTLGQLGRQLVFERYLDRHFQKRLLEALGLVATGDGGG